MNSILKRKLKSFIDKERIEPRIFKKNNDILECSYVCPIEDESIRKRMLGGHNTEYIEKIFRREKDYYFLNSHNKYRKLIDNGGFNPFKEYEMEKYYVDNDSLFMLDEISEFRKSPNLKCNYVYVGNKGSGKTVTQNIWLKRNNEFLENNNIFWVRCDGHKLYKLWLDHREHLLGKNKNNEIICDPGYINRLVNIEDYLDIQFVYVFAKYCLCEERNFIKNIVSNLKVDNPSFEYPISRRDTALTEERNLYIEIEKIRNTIIKEEKGQKESYSYAYNEIMWISQDSSQRSKRRWLSISKALQSYFSEKDIWLLRIVDGVDNVHINEKSSERYYNHMTHEAFKFIKTRPKDKHIHFMAMRERTLIDIKVNYPIQQDTSDYIEVEEIENSSSPFKYIVRSRYVYAEGTCFESNGLYDHVARSVMNSTKKDTNFDGHSNVREYLHNKMSLISQVYYRVKQLGALGHNIDAHVNTLKDRNKYLNGRLFLNTKRQWPEMNNEQGLCSINMFYYDVDKYPTSSSTVWFGLGKTRILQLLKDDIPMYEVFIVDFLVRVLGYPESLVDIEIKNLRALGMIDTKYEGEAGISYFISTKGKGYLSDSYSNIDTLYYYGLDTPLPKSFIENRLVSGHDNTLHRKTYYPYSAITNSIAFISFLSYINSQEEARRARASLLPDDQRFSQALTLPLSNRGVYASFVSSANRLMFSMDSKDEKSISDYIETIDNML